MVNLLFIYFFLISKVYSNLTSTDIQKSINSSININNSSNFRKKNLIIGTITNYDWNTIAPFIASYVKSSFENCDLIIFVYNITKSTITKIKSFGVIVYEVPEKYRYKQVINFRWKIYEDFLTSNINKYNLVLSTDLRDVFFQNDFFKYYDYNRSFLGVALEDGNLSQPINQKWLIDAYGQDLYDEIKNQRIICVGTVWGTIDKLIEFSKVMWEILDSQWSLRLHVIEQAVANYIIYHDKMFNDCLIKSENKDGLLMTIGLTKEENIFFDLDDNLVNGNGKIAAVIHQYDRKPQIIKKIMNKYFHKKEYEKQIIFILIFIIIILNIIILCLIFNKISKKKSFHIINPVKILKLRKSFKNNIKNLDQKCLEKVNIK